ncbi:cholinesterase 1-like [Chelonus insularis]|uniref:cholinesterase 1-like n=1 Tax=Chelonus insularis TaxID=460826 RepID=UPI0015899B76|nr:cholinesterase 1-like [Chelonus insularis]
MMMNFNIVIIFFLYCVILVNSQGKLTDVVQTKYGPVRGEIYETVQTGVEYSSFRGIPYAKPPVGKLRFQPPQVPNAWTEVLDTMDDPSPCPQLDGTDVIGDEDCLYLNVYSPELKLSSPKELRAVMVWIYGGAFVSGSVNTSSYRPDFLIEKDVVVVSMNYRLGALGFLTLGNEMISGNAGLKDQTLALKWVNENIKEFGGDPNKITIFGESAGSISVELHHLSSLSYGLFRASIAMSGSPINPWAMHSFAEASNISIQRIQTHILSTFDANSTEDVSKLYEVSVDELVLLDDLSTFSTEDFTFAFAPTVEVAGAQNQPFITDEPFLIYQSGNFYHVPHILGYMNNEAISWRKVSSDPNIGNNRTALDRITFDEFRVGINLTRQLMIDSSSEPVFYYRNVFEYPEILHKINGIALNGSGHGDDVGYVFYVQGANQTLNPNDEVSIFRNKFVTLWTNFAKYLDPSAVFEDGTEIQWPPTDNAGRLLKINSTFEILAHDD